MSATESLDATVEALCGDLSSDPRAARNRAERALVGDRGAAAHAAEQPRPRGRRAPGGARRLRRLRPGGAEPRRAARDRRARCSGSATTRRCSSRAASRSASSGRIPGAPRVLIANSLLVPRWATWDEFRRLEALGLTMFGQMTAGSWIYIGTQGILQGTYQTFAAAAEKHFGSADLAGRTILTAGLGGMGGAQPLAATMAGRGDPLRRGRSRRGSSGGSRRATSTRRPTRSTTRSRGCGRRSARGGRCRSACSGTRPRSCPELARRGEHFDLVTDQTAAHDPLTGYVPVGLDVDGGRSAARVRSRTSTCAARASRSRRTSRACSSTSAPAATFSIMATTCEGRPRRRASRRPSHTRASSRPISGRSSAAASGRSAGRRCRATRRTSPRSTRRCASSSRTTASCSAGSSSRPSASRSRGCRRGSAGSATATARRRGSRSTSSSGPGA